MFHVKAYLKTCEMIRKANLWSRADLCKKMGIGAHTLIRAEKGATLSYKTLNKIKNFVETYEFS